MFLKYYIDGYNSYIFIMQTYLKNTKINIVERISVF